ncbi:hypothetical protein D6C85_09888 [Aureobasidium pullulans]|uniref:Prion-inhibition and propagation HeLo domain-containing protein n=1 Tax=Aureobasidium pullulans TaxID=5580 RepID=A0A4S9W5Y3_AURPU|nr:hypothetical protein D6D24_10114 [Aureobasidium pullulans]THZ59988.1 hypothetical protein D6C85_09888 [Aureobasidium pullulans]
MAEAAVGLGISVFALSSLFNNVIDSYQYVRLGKQYARDFATNQTKLDLSRLQLSRWGEALHLDTPLTEIKSLPVTLASPDGIDQAQSTLGQILDLLEVYQNSSAKYAARNAPEADDTLDPSGLTLHQKVHKLISQRQRQTSLKTKTAWALYGKDDLTRLVGDITELTSKLVELFPTAKARQLELARTEVNEIEEGIQSLSLVHGVAQYQDKIFFDAVKAAMLARGHTFSQPHARDGASQHNGDNVDQEYRGPTGGLSYVFDKPVAEGQGTYQHNGVNYGGTVYR